MADQGERPPTVGFVVITPDRILLTDSADMVVAPGGDGDFGVLPGHAPFISTVRAGVIDVYEGDKIDQRIFVADGFAEVNERGCIVLSSEAYPVDELDRGEERLKAAQDELADADSDDERDKAEAEIAVCEAMLVAIA